MNENKFRKASMLLLLLLFCSDVYAQQSVDESFFPIWDARGKEGYMDARGNTVIAPQFEQVTWFSEGMAAVRVGKKWGYIDRTGKLIIEPRWKEAHPFKDGAAAVIDGQAGYAYTPLPEEGDGFEIIVLACGYIDKSGRYLIAPSLERKLTVCPDFAEGLAPVNFDPLLKFFFKDFADAGKGGYIDKTGQWAIKPVFEGAWPFSDGLALVRFKQYQDGSEPRMYVGDFAFIDRTGKIIFELKGYYEAREFHEGLALVVRRRGKVGFVDRTGRMLFELESNVAGNFADGRAFVMDLKTKLYGYIDQSGKWVIPAKYTSAMPFAQGLANVCTDPNTCFDIDTQGKVVFEHGGDDYRGGLSLQYLYTRTIGPKPDFRNIYGYRNREGKYVWVSPGGELFFGKKWWRENYIGPHPPETFSKP